MKRLLMPLALLPALAFGGDLEQFPDGKTRSLTQFDAPVRVLNVWATWCAPCRKEMPAMSAWYKKQKKGSVSLIGAAIDRAENIENFLKTTPVSYPVWRYTGKDTRGFMKSLGNQAGVVPYTLVEKQGCSFKQSITGEVTAAKLNAAVAKVKKQCR
ncbi:MAG: TlpA disulfide reductase family protein [Neisseria sp.]|nr:TlpA disulfide reductase family protein [Neisseria sp.]